MRTVPPTEKGKYKAFASGAITNGKPVVVNSAGTVSQVSGTAQSLGSESEFTTDAANHIHIVHDSNSNKNVIIYRDGDAKGTARVGTVSGTSISYGTAVEFEQGNTENMAATFDSDSNKVVIAFRDSDDSNYGKAVVGTVSGTDISFGSTTTFEAAGNYAIGATFDSSNNKVVIVYTDNGNSDYGTAIVGTVSGTSISFGTPVVFQSSTTYYPVATFDTTNNKVVICYSNGQGYGIVGTVSGTGISFGSATAFPNSGGHIYLDIAYDSTSGKVLVVGANGSNSNYGEATVGTVSGTSISFGTTVTYEGATSTYNQVVFDTNANKAVVAFRDQGDSNKGKFILGTISGTDVSFSGLTEFNAATEWIGAEYDSTSEKVLIGYRDQGDGDDGTVRVLQNAIPTNLTTENYIGIASGGTYADGQSVTVDTRGTVNDDQSSLTAGQQYFVQEDGTLGLTADSTSVVAGIAISATELIVKE